MDAGEDDGAVRRMPFRGGQVAAVIVQVCNVGIGQRLYVEVRSGEQGRPDSSPAIDPERDSVASRRPRPQPGVIAVRQLLDKCDSWVP